jgi:hypothetical protein
MMQFSGHSAWFLVAAITAAGCSQEPARVQQAALDPEAIAKGAMAEYDTNGDGSIAGDELLKAASINASLAKFDTNNDHCVRADEIAARVQAWRDSKLAVMQVMCTVTLNNRPLSGATVKFVPEKFLGPDIKPAEGTTNEQGMANVKMTDEALEARQIRGVQVGLYRVEITKNSGGTEMVPARYNAQTQLGQEVARDIGSQGGIKFELKSR